MQASNAPSPSPTNGTAPLPAPWTARRWGWMLVISLVLQAALIIHLGERPKPLPPPPRFGPEISLAADAWAGEQLARLPTLADPTLFALPSLQGFSGPAWMRFSALEHEPVPWSEAPRWLTVDTQHLGRTFGSLLATNPRPPLLVADKPMPRLIGADAPVPSLPLRRQSVLRLTGDLARRRLLAPLALKAWAHTDILSNSVVQALVDAQGRVLAATLLHGSGLNEADQHALRQATGARFDPLPHAPSGKAPSDLARGRLIFQWHTVPPSATNAPTKVP